jgi:hypothetical protein
MDNNPTVHEPEAILADAQDAIEDADRLQELLERNRQSVKREIQINVPFSAIVELVEQLDLQEVSLLIQRLEGRLEMLQS